MKEPKYDNDAVLYGFLKKLLRSEEDNTDSKISTLPKSYSSPPAPPYYKESLLSYQNAVYKCISTKLVGLFSWSDWVVIATDDTTVNNFIENTYSTDKLELQTQIDGKVETFYQENDPAIGWTTDLLKAKHVGDYWYNTTNDTQWRYNQYATNPITYGWSQVNVPMAVYDLIDEKKSIYTEKPTSYKKDDLWIIESTLSDADLPIGTEENPIIKGDWVFASQNSDTYNKVHWIKKDEDISKTYLEQHYYNTTTLDTKFSEAESETASAISQAKNEIELEVSQTYTTKAETETIINDYDTQIGNINETITTQGENISDLSVETGRISGSVSSLETITVETETKVNNNYQELNGKIDDKATTTSVTELRNEVTASITDANLSIDIINETLADGVSKVKAKSVTIDDSGLTIDENDSKVKSNLDTEGVVVIDKTGSTQKNILEAIYDNDTGESRVKADRLYANKFNAGNYSRIENYTRGSDTERTGIFHIG